MLHQLTSAALSQLGNSQKREEEIVGLVAHARLANGSTSAYLKSKVRSFEMRYEMSSAELLRVLEAGNQQETSEIAEWLFLLETLEVHAH